MSVKFSEFVQSKFFLRYLTIWFFFAMFGYLIAQKHIPVRQIALEFFGVHALLGSGGTDGWKPILSKLVLDSETPWLVEAGLFLYINHMKNIDGRHARNYGEICYAVRHSSNPKLQNNAECFPGDFARARLAIDTLNQMGFIEPVKFARDRYFSYQLNALGNKAFEAVREEWISEEDDRTAMLALMDIGYPGFRKQLLASRNWYGKHINIERQVPTN